MPDLRLIAWMILVSTLLVASQLLLKQALVQGGPRWLGIPLTTPAFWGAFLPLGLAGFFWLRVLQGEALSRAYPLVSLSYVLMLLASALWFKEPVQAHHVVGTLFIVAGTVLVTWR